MLAAAGTYIVFMSMSAMLVGRNGQELVSTQQGGRVLVLTRTLDSSSRNPDREVVGLGCLPSMGG